MQTHANARQILAVVDHVRPPRQRLKDLVNGADADRNTQQVTHELHDATIRAVADQRQRDDHLAQPGLGDRQLEQHLVFRCGG